MKRVFVVDDHPVMRRGYEALLAQEPGLEWCGEASSAEEAIAKIPEAKPDLVIADLTLEGLNGIELVKRLQALIPGLPVLVVSMHDEGLYAERALRAGARGYLMKSHAGDSVAEAVRRILGGGFYFSDAIQQRIFLQHRGQRPEPAVEGQLAVEGLTDRELELFEHLGRGLTTRQIADTMRISPKTVETHRTRVREKLGVETTAELVRRAVLWVQAQEASGV
ncbi:MAG TPA: response regulator transcription factor [Rubricoccaceae bacterium]|nr:response regulator transcription factor [Rubricoccaceae bacterium]